jgi:hypothetical protein
MDRDRDNKNFIRIKKKIFFFFLRKNINKFFLFK